MKDFVSVQLRPFSPHKKTILQILMVMLCIACFSSTIYMIPHIVKPVYGWDHTFQLNIAFMASTPSGPSQYSIGIQVNSNCCKENDKFFTCKNCYTYLTLGQIRQLINDEIKINNSNYMLDDYDGSNCFDTGAQYHQVVNITGEWELFKSSFRNCDFTGAYCYSSNNLFDANNKYKKHHLGSGALYSTTDYIGFSTWKNKDDGGIYLSFKDQLGISVKYDGTSNAPGSYSGATNKSSSIKTANDLRQLRDNVNNKTNYDGCTFNLENNINLNGEDWKPIGMYGRNYTGGKINYYGNYFSGIFNGNSHKIYNFKIKQTKSSQYGGEYSNGLLVKSFGVGLFGYMNNALIKNLHIEDAELNMHLYDNFDNVKKNNLQDLYGDGFSGNSSYHPAKFGGIIAGVARDSTITNCEVTNSIVRLNNTRSHSTVAYGTILGTGRGSYNKNNFSYNYTVENSYSNADLAVLGSESINENPCLYVGGIAGGGDRNGEHDWSNVWDTGFGLTKVGYCMFAGRIQVLAITGYDIKIGGVLGAGTIQNCVTFGGNDVIYYNSYPYLTSNFNSCVIDYVCASGGAGSYMKFKNGNEIECSKYASSTGSVRIKFGEATW